MALTTSHRFSWVRPLPHFWYRPHRLHGNAGHLKFLWHSESSVIESRFLREYGGVVRIRGPFLVRQNPFGVVVDVNGHKGGSTLDRRP